MSYRSSGTGPELFGLDVQVRLLLRQERDTRGAGGYVEGDRDGGGSTRRRATAITTS
jgi:hypothetical protein